MGSCLRARESRRSLTGGETRYLRRSTVRRITLGAVRFMFHSTISPCGLSVSGTTLRWRKRSTGWLDRQSSDPSTGVIEFLIYLPLPPSLPPSNYPFLPACLPPLRLFFLVISANDNFWPFKIGEILTNFPAARSNLPSDNDGVSAGCSIYVSTGTFWEAYNHGKGERGKQQAWSGLALLIMAEMY